MKLILNTPQDGSAMAQSGLFKELYCSVCLCIFNDPVNLPCDHTFCRACIRTCLNALRPQCPVCRTAFTVGTFRPNRALRNMADGLKAEIGHSKCPEHEEKMKLFCQTDRQLICVVCRDDKTHRGHSCMPIGEAAALSKDELGKALEFLSKDNCAQAHLISQQGEEMRKIKKKSTQMIANISAGFQELQAFLRVREVKLKEEVMEEEKRALVPMKKNLAVMTRALEPRMEKESVLKLGLDMDEPDRFQQWWLDTGSPVVEQLKNPACGTSESRAWSRDTKGDRYKSEVDNLCVIPDTPCSLNLGPYESHLQFFVWKEMLQVIETVPDCITVDTNNDPVLKVSSDMSSVRHVELRSAFRKNPIFSMSHTWSREGFQSGQHYWEVTVGQKDHWSLGLEADPHGDRQTVCRLNGRFGKHRFKTEKEVQLDLRDRPRVIGTYLDCARKRVAFYNADSMALIASTAYETNKPLFAYFNPGFYFEGENADPLTVRLY